MGYVVSELLKLIKVSEEFILWLKVIAKDIPIILYYLFQITEQRVSQQWIGLVSFPGIF